MDARNSSGHTALHTAAASHQQPDTQQQLVQQLLRHGASAGVRDAEGNTTLHFAAAGTTAVLQRVLVATSSNDVSTANAAGKTALMIAAGQGRVANCRALLARSAGAGEGGRSALVAAAGSGQRDVVRLLVRHGVQPSVFALAAAASHQHTAVMELLLTPAAVARMAPTGVIYSSFTAAQLDVALVAAAARGHTDGVALLLRHGALPSHTALTLSAACAGHAATLEHLLARLHGDAAGMCSAAEREELRAIAAAAAAHRCGP